MDIRRNLRRILGRSTEGRNTTKGRSSSERAKAKAKTEADTVSARRPSPLLHGESADLHLAANPNSSPSTTSTAISDDIHDSLTDANSVNSITEKQSTDSTSLEDIGPTPPPKGTPPTEPSDAVLLASSEDISPRDDSLREELASTLQPEVVVQQPTPPPQHENLVPVPPDSSIEKEIAPNSSTDSVQSTARSSYKLPSAAHSIPSIAQVVSEEEEPRRQSLVSTSNVPELQQILTDSDPSVNSVNSPPGLTAHSSHSGSQSASIAAMLTRKIWVKRPGASATLVAIREDDLVDDARDKILTKYSNSLGRTYDSPDVTLRIAARSDGPRSQPQERLLGPEEDLCRVLDSYYPGGQTVTEALIIDIPPKRTPRPSPRHQHHNSNGHNNYHSLEEFRPHESGTDYFPPMPAVVSTVNGQTATIHDPRTGHAQVLQLPEHTRSISVLQTGQVPPLPSPGAATRRHRPKYARQHTSSPTILAHPTNPSTVAALNSPNIVGPHMALRNNLPRPRHDSNASERPNGVPAPPPLPTPPAPEAPPTAKNGSTPPTPVPRDHHRVPRPRKTRKVTPTNGTATTKPSALSSLLDGSVPPINVLIVEDNIINLKLLEAFMKRLKVRWSTAMNGQIAVNKWRAGGFHLVLMDIQLPIMSGLDATKEIRRLERVNGIGVFSNSQPGTPNGVARIKREDTDGSEDTVMDEGEEEKRTEERERDRLVMDEGLFKSPVIIVALTASSLQSDRHEALAAGCNDFLTKPVNFVWLERKVKEWGCMQALIDFDGWRKWKDFSSDNVAKDKNGGKVDGVSKADLAAKAKEKKKMKEKRASLEASGGLRRTAEEGE
ncbi:Response regulator mcs4-like protein [Elsinoe fawcettii]|nr:Response regulator mcs4-like protein [Elsinoe fawcettii]